MCIALLVMLLSGDIQTNPGPILAADAYPCAWCEAACDWSQSAICCDNCSYWFHRSCRSMPTEEYIRRGGSDESWECPRCKTHNVDSFSYRGYNLSVSNRYEALSSISEDVFPQHSYIHLHPLAATLSLIPCLLVHHCPMYPGPVQTGITCHPSHLGNQIPIILQILDYW